MRYISLLRGINVGGHRKILMADLKALYGQLGFDNIVSYIQSGNVVFDSDNANRKQIIPMIETAISEQYGFDVPIILRTHAEIKNAIQNMPFGEIDLKSEGAKYFLTMLSEKPKEEDCEILLTHVKQPERMVIDGENLYTYYQNGAGRSQLTNTLIEKKLKVRATSRNWKTTIKLYELSS